MNTDDLSRLAGYLYAAVEAGRATKDDWRAWADRMIEADVTPDWIIDLSLARSKEQAIAQFGMPGGFETDSALRHVAIRLSLDEITLREYLVAAIRLAREGGYGGEHFEMKLGEKLERLDEGTPESTIFAELAPLLAPLIDEAERQWKELFPES